MSVRPQIDPVEQWSSIISLSAEIAIAEMIETICREADLDARAKVGTTNFVNRLRGQLCYFRIEDGFLGLGEKFPELAADAEFHLGNSAKFAAIDRPDLRVTLAHLENYSDNPFARPFRQGKLTQEQSRKFVAGQTSFFKPEPPSTKRLIAAVCFDFANNVPLYTEVRFADAEWQCRNEYRDIRAALISSRSVPLEPVSDSRDTSTRVPTHRVTPEAVPEQRKTEARKQNIEHKEDA